MALGAMVDPCRIQHPGAGSLGSHVSIGFLLHILDRALARIVFFLAHRYTLYLHLHQNGKHCYICYNTMYFLDRLLPCSVHGSVVYLANRAQIIFEAIVRLRKSMECFTCMLLLS